MKPAIDSPTKLVELSNNGRITEYEISPETFGIKIQEHSSLVANSPKESLKIAKGGSARSKVPHSISSR